MPAALCSLTEGVLSHEMKRYIIDASKAVLNRPSPDAKVSPSGGQVRLCIADFGHERAVLTQGGRGRAGAAGRVGASQPVSRQWVCSLLTRSHPAPKTQTCCKAHIAANLLQSSHCGLAAWLGKLHACSVPLPLSLTLPLTPRPPTSITYLPLPLPPG